MGLGLIMTIEDTWCGEIADAAFAHLAHSPPPDMHFQSPAFHESATRPIAVSGPGTPDVLMAMAGAPGLGVKPGWKPLGQPIASISPLTPMRLISACDLREALTWDKAMAALQSCHRSCWPVIQDILLKESAFQLFGQSVVMPGHGAGIKVAIILSAGAMKTPAEPRAMRSAVTSSTWCA